MASMEQPVRFLVCPSPIACCFPWQWPELIRFVLSSTQYLSYEPAPFDFVHVPCWLGPVRETYIVWRHARFWRFQLLSFPTCLHWPASLDMPAPIQLCLEHVPLFWVVWQTLQRMLSPVLLLELPSSQVHVFSQSFMHTSSSSYSVCPLSLTFANFCSANAYHCLELGPFAPSTRKRFTLRQYFHTLLLRCSCQMYFAGAFGKHGL